MTAVETALRLLRDPGGCAGALAGLRTAFLREDELDSDAEFYYGYYTGYVQPAARTALPVMLDLVERRDAGCRAGIVELIGEVAKTGERPGSPDEDWVRRWAGAVPRLLALLHDADPEVRSAAAIAVANAPAGDRDGTVSAALRSRFDAEDELPVRLNLVSPSASCCGRSRSAIGGTNTRGVMGPPCRIRSRCRGCAGW